MIKPAITILLISFLISCNSKPKEQAPQGEIIEKNEQNPISDIKEIAKKDELKLEEPGKSIDVLSYEEDDKKSNGIQEIELLLGKGFSVYDHKCYFSGVE